MLSSPSLMLKPLSRPLTGDFLSDAMEDNEGETEEEEGDKILQQVLDEIGINVSHQLGETPVGLGAPVGVPEGNERVAIGEGLGGGSAAPTGGAAGSGGGAARGADVDDFQARLDSLRRD